MSRGYTQDHPNRAQHTGKPKGGKGKEMLYKELIEKAMEELNNNDELFVEMVNELDSWNGFADGYRAFPMYELDELFSGCSVSEFLDKLASGFNHNDEYLVDTIWGIDSTNDIAELYRENTDAGEVLDEIINHYNHIYFSDSEFGELISDIVNYEGDETAA